MTPRVWTFRLVGDAVFRCLVEPPGRFPTRIDHEGGVSLHALTLTTEQAQVLESKMVEAGLHVQRTTVDDDGERDPHTPSPMTR